MNVDRVTCAWVSGARRVGVRCDVATEVAVGVGGTDGDRRRPEADDVAVNADEHLEWFGRRHGSSRCGRSHQHEGSTMAMYFEYYFVRDRYRRLDVDEWRPQATRRGRC